MCMYVRACMYVCTHFKNQEEPPKLYFERWFENSAFFFFFFFFFVFLGFAMVLWCFFKAFWLFFLVFTVVSSS